MDELGERILDAAVEAASIHGITRLSVADVAKRAGLSRPTLYKRYPSKSALVSAAVVREAARVIEAVQQAVDAVDRREGAKAALVAGIGTALRLLREHPLLDRIVRSEPDTLVPALTTDDGLVLSVVRPPIEAMIVDRFPPLDPVATRRVADMLTRLLISYALSAPDDPPEVVAAVVAAIVVDGASSLVTEQTHREGT
ncbi:MAG TPA: TetR family transcriptional regulator [Acidimicrobiales bacterium]|nr:TetR family transcriptional regulator [Acidimicrobiales bacterium]